MRAEVPNPMVFTVFSTPADRSCVLAVRADRSWNVSIYVGFACQQANHTVFTVFLLVFSRPIFSTRSDPMVFTVFCTPLHCLCALCLLMFLRVQPRKACFFRCLVVCQKTIFPPGPVSACYFDSAGWAGGGGGGCEPVWHIPVTGCAFAPCGCKKKKPTTGFASHYIVDSKFPFL